MSKNKPTLSEQIRGVLNELALEQDALTYHGRGTSMDIEPYVKRVLTIANDHSTRVAQKAYDRSRR